MIKEPQNQALASRPLSELAVRSSGLVRRGLDDLATNARGADPAASDPWEHLTDQQLIRELKRLAKELLLDLERWQHLVETFASVADNDERPRLEEEANYFSLTVDDALFKLQQLDPEKALKLFREKNPDIDLNQFEPEISDEAYEVSVRLLQLLVETRQ